METAVPLGFQVPACHLKKNIHDMYIHVYMCIYLYVLWASQVAPVVKNPPANAGNVRDAASIPGSGRSPGGGHGNPLQYSCLEKPWAEEPGGLQSLGSQICIYNTHIYVTQVHMHLCIHYICYIMYVLYMCMQ